MGAQAEATSLRSKENEDYLKASKDYKDSADAVANAISVLQEYYASASFAQVKEEPELGGAKTDIATTIMGFEKATAAIAELKQQIKTLQEQTAEMDAAQAEATSLRSKENEDYLKASKDYKDSADAVANAISVLQEYYASASFAQVKET